MNATRRLLSLELLESRTLLAADPFGLVADFEQATFALTGTGEFDASFSINFGNHQLVLSGKTDDSLTIDMDRLPAFITNLRISSFSEVKFVGNDHVETIVFNNIGSVVGPDLSVTTSLHVNDVGSLNLANAGTIAVLKGSNTELKVRSLDGTMIISDLQSLTIDSDSHALLVVVLNSEQKLHLNYVPESIAFPGLVPTSVDIVNNMVLPGTGTGMDSAGDGSAGSPDGHQVGVGSDPVVIINVPLDERTRAFIAELRELLRTSTSDPQQLVFDFMRHGSTPSGQVSQAVFAGRTAPALESIPPDLSFSDRLGAIHGSTTNLPDELTKPWASSPSGQELLSDGGSIIHRPIDTPSSNLPAADWSSAAVEIDATWPVAAPPSPSTELSGQGVVRTIATSEQGTEEIKLEDSVRALGQYLVERVSAEFSPGQQSLILLVDPRPSRSVGTNPASALDLFSRSSRTSISRLQEAVA